MPLTFTDVCQHPLMTARCQGDFTTDRLLSELADTGTVDLRRSAPTPGRRALYWVELTLLDHPALVHQIRQPGTTVTEAAARALLGTLIELDLHVQEGLADLSALAADGNQDGRAGSL